MTVNRVAGMPPVIPPLPPGATMAIWPLAALREGGAAAGPPLYISAGKWLHPLFEMIDLLEADGPAIRSDARATLASAGDLFLRDRIIGRGAAFLILRAGIRNAWADVVSDGAMALFEAEGASLGGGEQVAAIACRTEPLLHDVDDTDLAWDLLRERRAANLSQIR
jgi:hypothetical protein